MHKLTQLAYMVVLPDYLNDFFGNVGYHVHVNFMYSVCIISPEIES